MRYTTPQVCDLAGVTRRQLDYWLRTDCVFNEVPANGPGTGGRRAFSDLDVSTVRLMGALVDLGVQPRQAGRAAMHAADQPAAGRWLLLLGDHHVRTDDPMPHLAVHGKGVVVDLDGWDI